MRFDLSDDEWALLEPLMPKSRKSARADDRKIMNAIFYVLRTGMPWRDLPERMFSQIIQSVIWVQTLGDSPSGQKKAPARIPSRWGLACGAPWGETTG
jgi:transposase